MASYKIRFMPDEKSVEVEAGTTLMEAAEQVGIHINNLCGGEGVCGRCRVKLINGKIRADKHSISLLSREEITEGYVLACQTSIPEGFGSSATAPSWVPACACYPPMV